MNILLSQENISIAHELKKQYSYHENKIKRVYFHKVASL